MNHHRYLFFQIISLNRLLRNVFDFFIQFADPSRDILGPSKCLHRKTASNYSRRQHSCLMKSFFRNDEVKTFPRMRIRGRVDHYYLLIREYPRLRLPGNNFSGHALVRQTLLYGALFVNSRVESVILA